MFSAPILIYEKRSKAARNGRFSNDANNDMNSPKQIPNHVAIIMDGNGRWAKQRHMPRMMGHRAGEKSVRKAIAFCIESNIKTLTLFALSVENFQMRPAMEVRFLIKLLSESLRNNVDELCKQHIRLRVIGDLSVFPEKMRAQIQETEELTEKNTQLNLVLAINYSGRWDIMQAAQQFAIHCADPLKAASTDFSQYLCLQEFPEPDLLIRTGGDLRISNFMLWQFAYTELYFASIFWPDFNEQTFRDAVAAFQQRERRFGLTGEQIQVTN